MNRRQHLKKIQQTKTCLKDDPSNSNNGSTTTKNDNNNDNNDDDHLSSDKGKVVKLSKGDFMTMTVVGQFNLGFILALSDKGELWILDQHACDEQVSTIKSLSSLPKRRKKQISHNVIHQYHYNSTTSNVSAKKLKSTNKNSSNHFHLNYPPLKQIVSYPTSLHLHKMDSNSIMMNLNHHDIVFPSHHYHIVDQVVMVVRQYNLGKKMLVRYVLCWVQMVN